MPHIIAKKHQLIDTPAYFEGVSFLFVAQSILEGGREEYKICVEVEEKQFLLTRITRESDMLIKIDVTTKLPDLVLLKKALHAYIALSQCEVLRDNITLHTTKPEPQKEFLKGISYFVDSFNPSQKVSIEIGFGSGRHLMYQAKNNLDTLFIGLEIHTPSIEQVLKQIRIEQIPNILVVNYDARLFLEFIQSNTISQIFVHFPVPWDKKPHRRVMSKEFIDESLRVLCVEGSLELRTDSPLYCEYAKELYGSYQEKTIILKNQSLEVSSKYEDRWKKMGKDIWDLYIYAQKNNELIVINKDFDFPYPCDMTFKEITSRFPSAPYVENDFVVHFSHAYQIDLKSGIVHISMGSFHKPLSIYLMIWNESVAYFATKPIPTSLNHKAHSYIRSLIEEKGR